MAQLLHDLITNAAWKNPTAAALRFPDRALDYGQLAQGVQAAGQALLSLGIRPGERVAVLLDKRAEALQAMFGALDAGAVCVPLDPMLAAEQVALILRDCNARMLLTTPRRRAALDALLVRCPDLRCVLQTGGAGAAVPGLAVFGWDDCLRSAPVLAAPRCADSAAALLIHTRGAGARGRALALSHCDVLGHAARVGQRLGERGLQRSLALLPPGDGCGLALLAATFAGGAEALLVNEVLARDIPQLVAGAAVTSMAAAPWLWMQVAALDWHLGKALRCIVSAGGTLPRPTLDALRRRLPLAQAYLMHLRQAGGSEVLVMHPGASLDLLQPAG